MSMPEPVSPPLTARRSLLDRLTIQGIIALTICFAVIGLTLAVVYAKLPSDGPTIGIMAGTISGLMQLLGIIVKHFYDSAMSVKPTENRNANQS